MTNFNSFNTNDQVANRSEAQIASTGDNAAYNSAAIWSSMQSGDATTRATLQASSASYLDFGGSSIYESKLGAQGKCNRALTTVEDGSVRHIGGAQILPPIESATGDKSRSNTRPGQRLTDINDGTSNTIGVSERIPEDDPRTSPERGRDQGGYQGRDQRNNGYDNSRDGNHCHEDRNESRDRNQGENRDLDRIEHGDHDRHAHRDHDRHEHRDHDRHEHRDHDRHEHRDNDRHEHNNDRSNESGYNNGYDNGYESGYEQGYNASHNNEGYGDGRNENGYDSVDRNGDGFLSSGEMLQQIAQIAQQLAQLAAMFESQQQAPNPFLPGQSGFPGAAPFGAPGAQAGSAADPLAAVGQIAELAKTLAPLAIKLAPLVALL